MKRLNKAIVLLAMCLLVACKKNNTSTIEYFISSDFDTLVLADVFNVELLQDSLNKIEIIGKPNYVNNIRANVDQHTLTLSNENRMRWLYPQTNKILVKVHFSHISRIVANETCFIESKSPIVSNELGLILKSKLNQADLNIQCNTFYFWNNFPCGGSLKLKGLCQELKLWNYALMQVNATGLFANIARVENNSKGDIQLRCLDSLFYKILGQGNIELYGNPTNVYNLGSTGTGKLLLH
ncbi:MAG: GIN domain-containing protein [Bacteroidota bacterium]